jgi:hypothetical protein
MLGTAQVLPSIDVYRVRTNELGDLTFESRLPSADALRSARRLVVRLVQPDALWAAEIDIKVPDGDEVVTELVAESHPIVAAGAVRLDGERPGAGARVAVPLSPLDEVPILGPLTSESPPRMSIFADESGHFRVYGQVEAATTTLKVSYPGYSAQVLDVPVGARSSRNLVVDLVSGAGLTGRLSLHPLLPYWKATVHVLDYDGAILAKPRLEPFVDGSFAFDTDQVLPMATATVVVRLGLDMDITAAGPLELRPGEVIDLGLLDLSGAIHCWNLYPYAADRGSHAGVFVYSEDTSNVGSSSAPTAADRGRIVVCSKHPPPIDVTLMGTIEPMEMTLTADEPAVFFEVVSRANLGDATHF